MEFIVGGLIRSLCGFIVKGVFWIAEAIYGLFFAVSKVELFSGTVVIDLFKRLQLIIGVFVLFQLAVTIIKGIIEPNTFTDSKSGAGNLVKRVIIALLILTLIVPFNINTSSNNSYFLKVKEHGILFGTLYSLQNRILDNNTIGKLIFGGDIDDENQLLIPTNTTQTTIGNNGGQIVNTDTVEKAQTSFRKNLSVGVVRAFFAFNPNTESCNRLDYRGGKVSGEKFKSIHKEAKSVDEITDMVSIHCKVNGKEEWVIDYTPFLSGIMGLALAVLFFSFMFDVVVRAAKLAILRLLAPIPIISYMNPNGKDNAFDSWSKLLVSTYIDLFVRLATIYLMLFIASKLLLNLRLSPEESGIINFFATCVVIIGLLIFAKQAPKFVREVLGLKGDSGSLFGGLTEALAIGSGIVGAAATGLTGGTANATKLGNKWNKNKFTKGAGLLLGGAGGVLAGTTKGLFHQGGRYLGNDKPAKWSDVKATWGDTQQFRSDYAESVFKDKPKKTVKDLGNALLGYDAKKVQSQIMGQESAEAMQAHGNIMAGLEKDNTSVNLSEGFMKNKLLFKNDFERASGIMKTNDGHEINFNTAKSAKAWTSIRKSLEASGYLDDDPLLQNVKACEDYAKQEAYQRIVSSDYNSLDANGQNVYYNAEQLMKNIKRNSNKPGYAKIHEKWISNPTISEFDYSSNSDNLLSSLDNAYGNAQIAYSKLAQIQSSEEYINASPEIQHKVDTYYTDRATYINKHTNLHSLLSKNTEKVTITNSDKQVIGVNDKITFKGTDIIDLNQQQSLEDISKGIEKMKSMGANNSDLVQIDRLYQIKASEKVANVARAIQTNYNGKLSISSSDYASITNLDSNELSQKAIMYEGEKYIDFNKQYSINEYNEQISKLETLKLKTNDSSAKSKIDVTVKKIEELRNVKTAQQAAANSSISDPLYNVLQDEIDFSRAHTEIEELKPIVKQMTIAKEDTTSPHSEGIDKLGKTVGFKEIYGIGDIETLSKSLNSSKNKPDKKDKK